MKNIRVNEKTLDKLKSLGIEFYEQKEEKEEISNKFNEPLKPKYGEIYFFIESNGVVKDTYWYDFEGNIAEYNNGNCFKTREQAEQRAKEIKVYNLLKNFSCANNGGELDIAKLIDAIKWDSVEIKNYAIKKYDKEICEVTA